MQEVMFGQPQGPLAPSPSPGSSLTCSQAAAAHLLQQPLEGAAELPVVDSNRGPSTCQGQQPLSLQARQSFKECSMAGRQSSVSTSDTPALQKSTLPACHGINLGAVLRQKEAQTAGKDT